MKAELTIRLINKPGVSLVPTCHTCGRRVQPEPPMINPTLKTCSCLKTSVGNWRWAFYVINCANNSSSFNLPRLRCCRQACGRPSSGGLIPQRSSWRGCLTVRFWGFWSLAGGLKPQCVLVISSPVCCWCNDEVWLLNVFRTPERPASFTVPSHDPKHLLGLNLEMLHRNVMKAALHWY